MLQTTSQLPQLPRRLDLNRHKYNGFLSEKSVVQVQAAGGGFSWKQECEVAGFWVAWELSGSQQYERLSTHSAGMHPQSSHFLERTHGSAGFRECRGREVGGACFPLCCPSLCTWQGRAGSGAHYQSRVPGGPPGWWETQDWSRGAARGSRRLAWSRGGPWGLGVKCPPLGVFALFSVAQGQS